MAWRLDTGVIKGEIDNRTPGIVSGRVWFVGRTDPIVLTLEGNALRDLAGCLLTFTNPTPAAGDQISLDERQQGVAGDTIPELNAERVKPPSAEFNPKGRANPPSEPIPFGRLGRDASPYQE